jgi:hypothetical protein
MVIEFHPLHKDFEGEDNHHHWYKHTKKTKAIANKQ